MIDRSSTEVRRITVLSDHETADPAPSLFVQVKRLFAQIDALPLLEREALIVGLPAARQRMFRGCAFDQQRSRYNVLLSERATLQSLHDDLEDALA